MNPKKLLPYVFLFIVSVGIFLFVLFPQEQLASQLNTMLHSPKSKVQMHVERVKPALPFSLELINSSLIMDEGEEIKPQSMKILITPDLLFGANRQVKFKSEILKGKLKGSLGFKNTNPGAYKIIDFSIAGIEIEQFSYNTQMAEISLKCKINGDYSNPLADKKDGGNKNTESGKGSLFIENFSADLKNSLFNRLKISQVDFSSVNIDFTKKGKNLNITQLSAKGSIINVSLKGKVHLTNPASKSRIALTGAILPDSPYLASFINSALIRAAAKNVKKEGVRFSIKGTLEQPRITL